MVKYINNRVSLILLITHRSHLAVSAFLLITCQSFSAVNEPKLKQKVQISIEVNDLKWVEAFRRTRDVW